MDPNLSSKSSRNASRSPTTTKWKREFLKHRWMKVSNQLGDQGSSMTGFSFVYQQQLSLANKIFHCPIHATLDRLIIMLKGENPLYVYAMPLPSVTYPSYFDWSSSTAMSLEIPS